jgi:hypothetical protein
MSSKFYQSGWNVEGGVIQGENVTVNHPGNKSAKSGDLDENAVIEELFQKLKAELDKLPPEDREMAQPAVKNMRAAVEQAQSTVNNATEGEQKTGEVQGQVSSVIEESESRFSKSLRSLAAVAPDMVQVALATLANPGVGVTLAISKIAEKAKQELDAQKPTAQKPTA